MDEIIYPFLNFNGSLLGKNYTDNNKKHLIHLVFISRVEGHSNRWQQIYDTEVCRSLRHTAVRRHAINCLNHEVQWNSVRCGSKQENFLCRICIWKCLQNGSHFDHVAICNGNLTTKLPVLTPGNPFAHIVGNTTLLKTCKLSRKLLQRTCRGEGTRYDDFHVGLHVRAKHRRRGAGFHKHKIESKYVYIRLQLLSSTYISVR